MANHILTSTCALISLSLAMANPLAGQVDQQRAQEAHVIQEFTDAGPIVTP